MNRQIAGVERARTEQYLLTMTNQQPSNEQVRLEMKSFLEALNTYAERFARDPKVSFEEHFCSLIPAKSKGAAAD